MTDMKSGNEPAKKHGIMAIIDLVDFTPQTVNSGDLKTAQFTEYFLTEAGKIAKDHHFELTKATGDGAVFFGVEPEDFIAFVNDLYVESPIEEAFGFKIDIRIVAHSGYFHFKVDEKGNDDPVGINTIETFRLEKMARKGELVVSRELFIGIEDNLKKYKFEYTRETSPEPLEGFESLGNITIIYRITPPKKDENTGKTYPDYYKSRRIKLCEDSKIIPIFGNLYPPLKMEESFINLSLDKDRLPRAERLRKDVYCNEWSELCGEMGDIGDIAERKHIEDRKAYDRITTKEFYKSFNKGFIFGLPGAGKTTILKHVAYQVLTRDIDADILFVECKSVKIENLKKFGLYPYPTGSSQIKDIFKAFAMTFLFGDKLHNSLSADERENLDNTAEALAASWDSNKLIVLVDALDEAPSIDIRASIEKSCLELMKGVRYNERKDDHNNPVDVNTVYITSRIALIRDVDVSEEVVFYVKPISMEDMRSMAKRFWRDDLLYKRFDNTIWREPVVKQLAGTPLMAMLLLFYFETFGAFKLRYNTYDLVLKFILRRTWALIKLDAVSINIHGFCKEAEAEDFFDKYPDIKHGYNVLSTLSYDLLYETMSGGIKLSVTRDTIMKHFVVYLKKYEPRGNGETETGFIDRTRKRAEDWCKFFIDEHILISAGYDKYVFMHSTIMEFLAARCFLSSNNRKSKLLAMIGKNREQLETPPIASGFSYKDGAGILELMEPYFSTNIADKDKESGEKTFSTLPFRCLSEIEAVEFKLLEPLQTKKTRNDKLKVINQWC